MLEPGREARVVTLDAAVALDIAERLFPKLATGSAGGRAALEARNDSMHMGIAVTDRVDAAIAGMAAYVRLALPLLRVPAEEFWGDIGEAQVAGRAVQALASRVAEVVEAKIELATKRYAQLRLRLSDEEAARVIATLEARSEEHREGRSGFAERCPACENFGWVDIDADFDVEADGDGGWTYFQTAEWVAGFECPVCNLELTSEECEEAGLGMTEPDEDDQRDR